jgi:hypothetical protein
MLKALGHSGFDRFLLEVGLQDPNVGQGNGLMARANSLAQYAIANPQAVTAEGQALRTAIVARAGEIYREGILVNISDKERDAFQIAAAADGSQGDVASPSFSSGITGFSATSENRPWHSPQYPSQKNLKVFIVHGHDDAMREAVARYVAAIGLDPIILAEQTNGGRTVIEKFEKNADVGYAIILLSPDDQHQGIGRARQNVILEWGYFIGRLGRAHVCALKKGNVELPSDILGMVWQEFDAGGAWKQRLAQELVEAGYSIDLARALGG